MNFLLVVLIIFTALGVAQCERKSSFKNKQITFSNVEKLDDDGKFLLAWEVDTIEKEIVFEIEAETLGYVGFGISPQGSMVGADIFIAGVMTDGNPYSSDRFGIGFTEPTIDQHSDWTLLEASESSETGKTFLKLSRKLNTCDDEDYPITNGTNRLIWAMGDTDTIQYHTPNRRGSRSLNLLGAPIPDVDLDKMKKWEMVLEMEMPSEVNTAYWCSFHKGPVLNEKHHIVAFDSLLETKESLQHTHHFILYNCYLPPDSNQTMDEVFGNITVDQGVKGDFCYKPLDQQALPVPYCQEYLYVWAKGGKRMAFPENVGYAIGEGEAAGKQSYYMLEIHYDNPEMLQNVTFESGVQFYYTNNTRPIDAGLFAVNHGSNFILTVPPNTTDYVVVGHCHPTCTSVFPTNGIKVFNSLLHSHLSGRKLKLRQFRGNKELPWLDYDDHYDFDYQQNKPLVEEVVVLPGDQLTYECTYDSTWKDGEVVTGGLSTRNEMCEAFLWHYPKLDHNICTSQYLFDDHLSQFGITEYHTNDAAIWGNLDIIIDAPKYLQGNYEDSMSHKFNWTTDFLKRYQETHRFGSHDGACMNTNTGDYILFSDAKYPVDLIEYVPEDVCAINK